MIIFAFLSLVAGILIAISKQKKLPKDVCIFSNKTPQSIGHNAINPLQKVQLGQQMPASGDFSVVIMSSQGDQQECIELNILSVLPAEVVPFDCSKKMMQKYDIVLLDDDPLIHMTWTFGAEANNNSILCFSTLEELMSRISKIDPDSAFYIDMNLSGHINGDVVTKNLYNLGYKNIYLTTGYESAHFKSCDWLKAVAGKDFPR